MKYLIFGLGNPDAEYLNTRHNIGFQILDHLAAEKDVSFEANRYAQTCTVKHRGRSLILIKPMTYMNLSGKAVNYYMQSEKCKVENILIITDDLALPMGTIRIRTKGSDAGHNGLKDIIETLGGTNFSRLRFGIGDEFSKGKQVDFVLGEWTENEQNVLKKRIPVASDAVKSFAAVGAQMTMNSFNSR
ncbi:MAG: aminoacyl-tRNA hydrolase [Bacteroidia bacterium]|nr:aminoacyl-tRNA hydrolase [Bacteroidia bacterium]